MKIELPISENYVASWDVNHALRELFQNAIDRQKEGNFFAWEYDYDEGLSRLRIMNKSTELDMSTLVLGNTEKALKPGMIGKFGEGYKLALIVLLRNRCRIEIHTGSEIWVPSMIYSEKFKTRVMEIDILPADVTGNEDLSFVIFGLSPGQFKSYHRYNLHLQKKYRSHKTSFGEILFDDRFKQNIFVEGLHICKIDDNLRYGYNFNSDEVPLDRNRMSVSSFDVRWACQKMMRELAVEEKEPVIEMIRESKKDIEYIFDRYENQEQREKIAELSEDYYAEFIEEYGRNSLPVTSEYEKKQYRKKYTNVSFVMVSDTQKKAIEKSTSFQEALEELERKPECDTPNEIMNAFYEKYRESVFENKTIFVDDFMELLKESERWEVAE